MAITNLTVNGTNIVIDGDAQVFFDQETNTLRILTKEKVIEKVKVIETKAKKTFVPVFAKPKPVFVPVVPAPWRPFPDWERYTLCYNGSVLGK